MEKVTNSANSSCSIRYYVTLGSSFLGYARSDFHCSHHANITPGSPISGMDGNSSNSFRIFWYSSLVVVILSIGNYCSCVYFVGVCIWYLMHAGYFSLSAVGMAIFHNLKSSFAQPWSHVICLSRRWNLYFLYLIRPIILLIWLRRNDPDVQPCGMSDWQMTHNNDIAYASWDFNPLATLQFV